MCWPKCVSIREPSRLPPLNKSVLTAHLSASQTSKYILARQTDRHMDELSCRHLFSLCRREEGRKKGRSQEDTKGGERKEKRKKKAWRLLKFLSGCYCPWRVFKAGKGSLHRKTALRMLTVTLHSLWGRHRHLIASGDSCKPFHLQYVLFSSSIHRL